MSASVSATNEESACIRNVLESTYRSNTASEQDGSMLIKLPALENLPVSCPDCLPSQRSRSSQIQVSSSMARALGSSNILADKHKLFLIHESVPGHELIKQNDEDVYTCFGCNEKGFGPHHACRKRSCRIRFHEECKSLRLTIRPPVFHGLSFHFCSKPNFIDCNSCNRRHSDTSCSACGKYVKGYFYRSPDNKNHLHPCCANLCPRINCGDTEVTMELQQKTTSVCYHCKQIEVKRGDKYTNEVWSYVSVGENFQLHVGCIIEMLSEGGLVGKSSSRTLISSKDIGASGVAKIKLDMAARDIEEKWEKRFKKYMKYAKIALGAIISAFLGDPTTLVVSLAVAVVS